MISVTNVDKKTLQPLRNSPSVVGLEAGDPHIDYVLLNPATGAWTPEQTARQWVWLQADKVLT
jgi:hypothetical protein